MKPIVFIKLGGSLITQKEIPYRARMDVIRLVSSQIKQISEKMKDVSIILGNGAGSFGHYPAVQYKMTSGITTEEQVYGFCKVQSGVAKLNRIVTDQLVEDGVRAVSLHPSSMMTSKNGEPTVCIQSLLGFLKLGVIPVVYGDILYDSILGSHIFSTENIFIVLIKELITHGVRVNRVVHLGMVDGVLEGGERVIRMINEKTYPLVREHLYGTNGYDVTGGMKHKIEQALQMAKFGVKTVLTNGLKEGNIGASLTDNAQGTIIL